MGRGGSWLVLDMTVSQKRRGVDEEEEEEEMEEEKEEDGGKCSVCMRRRVPLSAWRCLW